MSKNNHGEFAYSIFSVNMHIEVIKFLIASGVVFVQVGLK